MLYVSFQSNNNFFHTFLTPLLDIFLSTALFPCTFCPVCFIHSCIYFVIFDVVTHFTLSSTPLFLTEIFPLHCSSFVCKYYLSHHDFLPPPSSFPSIFYTVTSFFWPNQGNLLALFKVHSVQHYAPPLPPKNKSIKTKITKITCD